MLVPSAGRVATVGLYDSPDATETDHSFPPAGAQGQPVRGPAETPTIGPPLDRAHPSAGERFGVVDSGERDYHFAPLATTGAPTETQETDRCRHSTSSSPLA